MNLEKLSQIPEMYDYYNRNNKELYVNDNVENILNNSLSKQIYKNSTSAAFLDNLSEMVSIMTKSNNIIRNWFNHVVSKYYDRHSN